MGNVALEMSEAWMPDHSGDKLAAKIDGMVGMASQYTSKSGIWNKLGGGMNKLQGISSQDANVGAPTNDQILAGTNQLAPMQGVNMGLKSYGGCLPIRRYGAGGSVVGQAIADTGKLAYGITSAIREQKADPQPKYNTDLSQQHQFGFGGNASPFGAIANGADQASQFAAKAIGNVYGDKKDPWANNVRTIAYGNADDNALFSKSQKKYVRGFANDLRNKNLAQNSSANTSAGLMSDLNKQSQDINSTVGDVGFGKKFLAANMASWQGAGKGGKWASQLSNGNPYATVAGWVIGGLAGLGRGIGKAINGKKYLRKLNNAITARNNYTAQSINDSVKNFGVKQNNQLSANWIGAMGGEMKTAQRIHDAFHKYAQGGELEQTDTDSISNSKDQFRTGITEFNVGGSHEENPYGGIPQGVAPDGMPNLVEEGEVKISDITGNANQYILSNRIPIDEMTAQQFGIDNKYIGLTFADAFKRAYKPLKERPNDPINRNELANLINKFQQGQEFVKQQREMQMQMALQSVMPEQEQPMPEDGVVPQDEPAPEQGMEQEQPMPEEGMEQSVGDMGGMPQEQPMPEEGAIPEEGMEQQPMMAKGGKMNTAQRVHNALHKFAMGGRLQGHRFDDGNVLQIMQGYLPKVEGGTASYTPNVVIGADGKERKYYTPKPVNGRPTLPFGIEPLSFPEYEEMNKANGGRGVTEEQLKQLLNVALQRKMTAAKDAYEKMAGAGAWNKLNDNQKALLVDTQYNVRGGVASFPKMVKAMARGDNEAMLNELGTGNQRRTNARYLLASGTFDANNTNIDKLTPDSAKQMAYNAYSINPQQVQPQQVQPQLPTNRQQVTPNYDNGSTTITNMPTYTQPHSADLNGVPLTEEQRERLRLDNVEKARKLIAAEEERRKYQAQLDRDKVFEEDYNATYQNLDDEAKNKFLFSPSRIAAAHRRNQYARNNERELKEIDRRRQIDKAPTEAEKEELKNKFAMEDKAEQFGLGTSQTMSKLMQAPAWNSLRNLLDKDKYINPNKYDKYYEDNKNLLHDNIERVTYNDRPQYVDPNYIMSRVRSIGNTGARSLANSYAGHGAAAAAGLMAQNQQTQNMLGDNALKALEYNQQIRQQDLQNRMTVAQTNAQAQNTLNMENDKLRSKANEEMAQTHASADQYNKQLRSAAFANAAKNLGQLGKYYADRVRLFNDPTFQTEGAYTNTSE